MTFSAAKPISSRFNTAYPHGCGMMLTLTAVAALLGTGAHGQTAETAAQAASQTQAAQPATAAPVVATAPKYATKDIERAFGFLDANKDSRISREEATGFRGVARHFDEADSNKDNLLTREEFENALNREKSR